MEKWKWIDGYKGRYKISNEGRVKSFVISDKGVVFKDRLNKSGYKHVALRKNGKSKEFLVARLVVYHFVEKNDNPEITVNHKNGNKIDDRAENLEWMNRSEQMYHAYDNKLKLPRKYKPVLDCKQAHIIKKTYSKGTHGHSALALAQRYGVSDRIINKIINEIPPYDYQQ